MPQNGIETRTPSPATSHQERRPTPTRAKGSNVGFRATATAGQPHTVPSATAAASQIVGLPVQAIITDHWKPKQAAMSGHAHGSGAVPGDHGGHDAERDQPPQDRRQDRQHGEGEQGGRRVQDVPGRELVAAGQLFRIEVRAAASQRCAAPT
jgi:hypothetical protein